MADETDSQGVYGFTVSLNGLSVECALITPCLTASARYQGGTGRARLMIALCVLAFASLAGLLLGDGSLFLHGLQAVLKILTK
jgi:hypothetical protein